MAHALAARARPLPLSGVPAGLHGLVELPGGRRTETEVLAHAFRGALDALLDVLPR